MDHRRDEHHPAPQVRLAAGELDDDLGTHRVPDQHRLGHAQPVEAGRDRAGERGDVHRVARVRDAPEAGQVEHDDPPEVAQPIDDGTEQVGTHPQPVDEHEGEVVGAGVAADVPGADALVAASVAVLDRAEGGFVAGSTHQTAIGALIVGCGS